MQIAKHASDKLLSMAIEHTEHTYSNVNSESDDVKLFDKLMAPCGEGCAFSTVPSVLTEVNKRPPKSWTDGTSMGPNTVPNKRQNSS